MTKRTENQNFINAVPLMKELIETDPKITVDELVRATGLPTVDCRAFQEYYKLNEKLVELNLDLTPITTPHTTQATGLNQNNLDITPDLAYPEDFEAENIKLKKSNQHYMDSNRICRKITRENNRIDNCLEELNKHLINVFDKHSLSALTVQHNAPNSDTTAVIHLSDLHFNELIDLPNNQYNFDIASIRLKLFADKIKAYLIPMKVKNVLIACTGDLLNSDRRLDEIMCAAENRTNAAFIAVDILQQFILDLNQKFNISILSVVGNESRVKDEMTWSSNVASDSYDYMIFRALQHIFKNSPGISFITGDCVESVVLINGQNVLFLHGNGSIKGSSTETSVTQIKEYGLIARLPRNNPS